DPKSSPPLPLIARQIASHLRGGQPASGALVFLNHINAAPSRTAQQERRWARTLGSIDTLRSILPDAIAALRTQSPRSPSNLHSLIGLELAARAHPADRIETLTASQSGATTALLVAQAIDGLDNDDERFDACVQIIRAHPHNAREVASACIRALGAPSHVLQSRASAIEPDERLLLNHIALALGRPDAMRDSPKIEIDSSIPLLGSEAQIAFLNGRWDHAEELLARLEKINTPYSTRMLARVLVSAQRPGEAWEIISANADFSDASAEDLAAASRIALLLNKPHDARSYIERSLETDPDIEESYEQLILLHSPGAPLEDPEEYKRVLRQLAVRLPYSSLVSLTRANELARKGLLREAETMLVDLSARTPHRQSGVQLLLGIWTALDKAGDEQAVARGEQWLEERLESMPSSVLIRLSLAQIYLQQERALYALEMLDLGYQPTGSFDIARAAEQVLANSLDRSDDAFARALERTSSSIGFDATLERAQQLALNDQLEESIQLLTDALPTTIELLPSQRDRLMRALFQLANTQGEIVPSDSWVRLFDQTSEWIKPVPLQLLRIRISMLAQLHPEEHEQLVGATIEALNLLSADATDEQHNALEVIAVQQLLADEHIDGAFAVLHALAVRNGTLDNRLGVEILRLSAGLGDVDTVSALLDRLGHDGHLDSMITLSNTEFSIPLRDRKATNDNERKADLAYAIASLAAAFNRDTTNQLLELALDLDENQPWANNDLGYKLVDANERLDEAEQMLVRALKALPDNPSVLDSLGWARYKQGKLLDLRKAGGQLVTEGATTLLERAIELDTENGGTGNATIHHHLGDTYWRLHMFDDAILSWINAERAIREQLQQASVEDNINNAFVSALSARLRTIRLKITDAESGQAPQLPEISTWTEPIPVDPRVEIDPMK
ncbi:MAG: hypothetical protein JKY96_01925, partial [Phycisphaerales bacterium]|nr:hypothetical protein [Phycisphaerales bacterium]